MVAASASRCALWSAWKRTATSWTGFCSSPLAAPSWYALIASYSSTRATLRMFTSPSGLAAADCASASRPESSSTAPADSTLPASRRRRAGRISEEEGRIEVIAVSEVGEGTAQDVNAGCLAAVTPPLT
jgi:hypothetical protein